MLSYFQKETRVLSRLIFVTLTIIGIAAGFYYLFPCSNSVYAGRQLDTQVACFPRDAVFPDYIQIKEMRFVAGMTSFNAWRIYPDDSLESATWNSNGELLGSNTRKTDIQDLYTRVTRLQITPKEQRTEDGFVSSRPAHVVTLSRSRSGRIVSVNLENLPFDLTRLIEELIISDGKLPVPESGDYLWVEPIEKPADLAVDLTKSGACTIYNMNMQNARAIVGGRLLTSVDLSFDDGVLRSPQLGMAIALKAGSGWYLVGRVRTPD